MNSLVFIEKEIKKTQLELDEETSTLHQLSRSRGEKWLEDVYKKKIAKIKNLLNLLEQIKSELEAWNVLKNSQRYVMYNKDIDTKKLMVKYTFITESENEEIIQKGLKVEDNVD